jgi:hypothetical protein
MALGCRACGGACLHAQLFVILSEVEWVEESLIVKAIPQQRETSLDMTRELAATTIGGICCDSRR